MNSPVKHARHVLGSAGLNRSMVLRRLIRLGHPRLRELRAAASRNGSPRERALAALVEWIESGRLVVPQGHGVGLVLDMRTLPVSHAHLGAIAFGTLESAVQEALVRHLGTGNVLYDIGANVGFFSLLGARFAGPQGRVYAIDAAPDNAAAIRRNAELNEMEWIEVLAVAVSDRAGTGRLQVVDDQSWSKLAEYGEHPFTERVLDVELVAIDDLLARGKLRPPDVVKIDVEGAELAVLRGMRETIKAHHPAIICELHDTHQEVAEEFARHGYRLINLEGAGPVTETGASAHWLALPPLHPGD